VIENVVRNAVRYAPSGTIDVTLAIVPVPGARPGPGASAPQEGSQVRLTVRDRGPGVPDASLPHLFLPFYRVDLDRERLTGGAGLGLAIARRAVESLGGRVSARNASPGLEVEIVLPLSRAQDP
jgi:two-component system sensor histidine kinase CpxA